MKMNLLKVILFSLCVLLSSLQAESRKEEIQPVMKKVYQAYAELQGYIYPKERFSDQHSKKIKALVKKIQDNFHSAASFDNRFTKQVGFKAHLNVLHEQLDEISFALKKGSYDWARWQLRAVANNCQTCHATYGIGVTFHDPSRDLTKLSPLQQGEFYAATRQYEKAKDAFFQAAIESTNNHQNMEALRKWLVITTRVKIDPDDAIKKIQFYREQQKNLPQYQIHELGDWIESFTRWKKNQSSHKETFSQAQKYIRYGLSADDPLSGKIHTVELLRGTAMVHRLLIGNTLTNEQHAEALYLLGLGYSKTRLYFIDHLPELYLERCIRSHPDTKWAMQAFMVYKDIMTMGYSGNSNEPLPGEIQLKIRELYDIAYGVPAITGRV